MGFDRNVPGGKDRTIPGRLLKTSLPSLPCSLPPVLPSFVPRLLSFFPKNLLLNVDDGVACSSHQILKQSFFLQGVGMLTEINCSCYFVIRVEYILMYVY